MKLVFLFNFILLFSKQDIEVKINKIHKNIQDDNKNIIIDILYEYYTNNVLTKNDINIILSIAATETMFSHIIGSCGEIGMMQVLPFDKHIQQITERICEERDYPICKKYILTAKRLYLEKKLAFEVGVEEFLFWKNEYNKFLKKKYWETPPIYLLSHLTEEKKKKILYQWNKSKRELQDYVFVAHYNWGPKFLYNNFSYLNKINSIYKLIKETED